MRAAKKKSLCQTAEDFANRTSIHGISYVFDREIGFVDRLLWLVVVFKLLFTDSSTASNLTDPTIRLVVVLAFLGLATLLSWNIWAQWREEQVEIYADTGNVSSIPLSIQRNV